MPREELLAALWPDTFVGEEVLTQVIRKLRAALGDEAEDSRLVETVRKRGYRLLATVAEEPEPGVASASRTRGHSLVRWAAGATIAGFAVAVAFAVRARFVSDLPPLLEGPLEQRRLTATSDRESEPAVSPDGAEYVFVSNPDGELDLFSARLDDPARLQLTRTPRAAEFDPRYSPDGRWIGFTRGEGGAPPAAWLVSRRGGRERLLDAAARFQDFSPDGREVLLLRRDAAGRSRLVRRRWDTTEPEAAKDALVLATLLPVAAARWSPDGQWIAFTDESNLWVVAATGGEPRAVGPRSDYIRSVAWDGSSGGLYCEATWREGRTNLWWVPLAAGLEPRALTTGGGELFAPAPSPDGGSVLHVEERKSRHVWRLERSGGGPTALVVPTTSECFAALAGGSALLISAADPETGHDTLARFDLADGRRTSLGSGFCPAVSADGRSAAFWDFPETAHGDAPAEAVLRLLDLESGARRALLRLAGVGAKALVHEAPALSPDGARVAVYLPASAERPRGLFLVDVLDVGPGAAASAPLLVAAGRFAAPAFSPDGRFLAASGESADGAGLHVVDLADPARRARRVGGERSYRAAPVWDRDGDGRLWLLVDERRRPRLLAFEIDAGGAAREPDEDVELRLPADPAFWGLFTVAQEDSGPGWLALSERYEADVYELRRAAR